MSNDYISRVDAKAAIQQALHDGTGYGEVLNAIPPADVRPVKRGEWIKQNPSNELDGDYYCSACGHGIDIADGSITPLDVGLKFCPNCGADMKEAANGESLH